MSSTSMPRLRTRRLTAGLLAGTMMLAACSSDGDSASDTPDEPDAVETSGAFGPACDAIPSDGEGSLAGMADDPAATAASANPLLSTLVSAVDQASLVDTLNGDGPFTIFAPTNDAFDAVPEDTLNMVLEDQELLTTVLTYHVVGGESSTAADLGDAASATSVQGEMLEFGSDGTTVNGVDVICSDVPTANATVHIVDEVLLPPTVLASLSGDAQPVAAEPTGPACAAVPTEGEGSFAGMADDPAATAASANPELSTLVTAVTTAGLVDTLNGEGPFTIFAPINSAFDAIPADTLDAVLADVDTLTSILTFHVVAGEQLSSAELVEAGTVDTVQGGSLTISEVDGSVMVNDAATVGCADVPTANATVHLIDAVLMP